MDLTKLKEGNLIGLKGDTYTVVRAEKDFLLKKGGSKTRELLKIFLVKNNEEKLSPTHLIKHFLDNGDTYLETGSSEKINLKDIEEKL
jgi:hypothetical protein